MYLLHIEARAYSGQLPKGVWTEQGAVAIPVIEEEREQVQGQELDVFKSSSIFKRVEGNLLDRLVEGASHARLTFLRPCGGSLKSPNVEDSKNLGDNGVHVHVHGVHVHVHRA